MVAAAKHVGTGGEDVLFDGVLVGVGQRAGVVDQVVGPGGVDGPDAFFQGGTGGQAFQRAGLVAGKDFGVAFEDRRGGFGEDRFVGQHIGDREAGRLLGDLEVPADRVGRKLGRFGQRAQLGELLVDGLAEGGVIGVSRLERRDLSGV